MKNKKYYFLLGLILLISIGIRSYLSKLQPMWIDEQYSILFATQFNATQLLINFSHDVHPGLYYLIIKILLKVTTNLFTLRLVTAIIPQVIGTFILAKTIKNSNKNPIASLLLTIILTINPFFIHLSWQLRSYGLIFLLVSISYLLLTKLKNKINKKYLLLLLVTLLIGNMLHYAMYIFSFFVITYLVYKWPKKSLKIKIAILLIGALALCSQFLIQNNIYSLSQYKSQFSEVSWISKPNINNIHLVYLVSLGFSTNSQLYVFNHSSPITLISYSLLLGLIIFIKKNIKKQKDILMILTVIPLLFIISISILLPFLSERWFIHQFIPNISIFIPRIHLPFIIIFWIIFSQIIVKKWLKLKKIFQYLTIIIFMFIISYWTYLSQQNYLQTSKSILKRQGNLKKITQNNSLENKQLLMWPHWTLLETINLNHLDKVIKIKKLQEKSKNFEEIITKNNNFSCSNLENTQFFTYIPISRTQPDLQKKITSKVKECCQKKEIIGVFQEWECNP